jgi:integrase/recombinase XerD
VSPRGDDRARDPWPARDLAAAALFLGTGVRLDELISARLRDLQDDADTGGRLTVFGKGAKHRTIPVHLEAAAVVATYQTERAERLRPPRPRDPLLVRHDGTPFTPAAMRRLVERWFTRAGVGRSPGAVVHALRHTFATDLLDQGATIAEVQRLLGHETLEATRRYLDVVGAGLHDAVRASRSRAALRAAVSSR